jgi:hypothetical protein
MRFTVQLLCASLLLAVGSHAETLARGFGAARGGFAVGPRGAAFGGARAGAGVGRYGGAYAGGAQGRSWVGPRGTEVQAPAARAAWQWGRTAASTPAGRRASR